MRIAKPLVGAFLFAALSLAQTNPARQEGPHAHSINLDAKNNFAFVADLGLDQVLVYKFDPTNGKLTPNDPPYVAVAAGATERAIARLLRGTTWQAVTREIAWQAAAAADGDYELAERVVGVADDVLSELIDGIECRVDTAVVRAW